MSLHVTFLYNKSNPFGISQDVIGLEAALRAAAKQTGVPGMQKPRHADPMEPSVVTDIAFHFEVPVYTYFPWSRKTVVIVNPEWWEEGWNAYLPHIDALLFKCEGDRAWFVENHAIPSSCTVITLPWTTPVRPEAFSKLPQSTDHATGFLWLLGGSIHKRAAAEHILPLWKESWPKLNVYTTTPLTQEITIASNVKLHVGDLDERTRHNLQAYTPGHLIFSRAEALGLAALEGEAAGAFLLGNDLPCFDEMFSDSSATALLPATLEPIKGKGGRQDTFSEFSLEQLESSIEKFLSSSLAGVRKDQQRISEERRNRFFDFVQKAWKQITELPVRFPLKALPPVITDSECPSISIITLLHNRRKFVDLALHNLILTDYPKNKIEWVVVEDSDITEEQASDKIMKFAREGLSQGRGLTSGEGLDSDGHPGQSTGNDSFSASPRSGHGISVTYIPLQKVVSIGEKRNMACKRAQHDICLMMDDDDHYPPSSFRRRVSWLVKHPWAPRAVCATTIACYDLLKGTSAVNTPPFTLGLAGRVSEATLAFQKSFWEERPFPTGNMAEGEEFLVGREHEVIDLQPQQIIVAMSHGSNISSRRIPPGPSGKPSCFWGFPKEFLVFLHRLAGVEIEEDKTKN
jgi:hypothetical protein